MKGSTIKAIAVFCAVFACFAIYEVISINVFSLNDMPERLFTLIAFVISCIILIYSVKMLRAFQIGGKIAYIALSFFILALGIFTIPYAPCHDSLDLHNILVSLIHGDEPDLMQKTYLDFWVNNKLTVLWYFPLAKLITCVCILLSAYSAILIYNSSPALSVTFSYP